MSKRKSQFEEDLKLLDVKPIEDFENVEDSENEDIFEMTLETPKIGGQKDDLKTRFEFDDIIQQKRQRRSTVRRDSRIGKLMRMSSKYLFYSFILQMI